MIFPRKLPQLLKKGSLAVTDQALFSGANFLVNVLLARGLEPASYGAYSVAYSAFLLLAALHTALLIEPMMIFGAGRYFDRFPRYLRLLVAFHAAVLAPTGLLLWVVSSVLGRFYFPAARAAFEGMAVGSGFVLLFWLVRRVFYVLMKPGLGVLSSCLYFLTLAGSVGVLWIEHLLTPRTAFLGMGAASLLACAILTVRWIPLRSGGEPGPTFDEIVGDHWRYGRWAVACAVMSWFPGNVYYALIPAWLGLEGAGAFRALTNFVMPVAQAITALNMVLLPALVRDRRDGGAQKMNQTMTLFFALFCAGCAAYLVGIWLFRGQIFQILYGGRYSEYSGWPLMLAASLPCGTCATAVLGNGLRALERPDLMVWAFLVSSAGAVVVGIPCTAKFGVTGALLGNHFSSVAFVAVLWLLYRSATKSEATVDASPSGLAIAADKV